MAMHPEHHTHDHAPHPQQTGLPAPAVDPAQESLANALHGSFNVLRVLMIVLVVLYLVSGIFRVDPGQQGLVARLGELRENPRAEGQLVFEPGWYMGLPDPFDQKFRLSGEVSTFTLTTFMFQHEDAATSKNLAEILTPQQQLTPGRDGAMYTGDKNLSHGRWEVQYRIKGGAEGEEYGAATFVRNVGETLESIEPLLQRLTETAVVREVAGRTVEEVTREALDEVRVGVRRRLQEALDRLETGVKVVQVIAYTIEPGSVRPAFLEVTKAENEMLKLQRQAEETATEELNRAAGGMHRELLAAIREYGEAQLQGVDQDRLTELQTEIDERLLAAERAEAGQVAIRLRDARAAANEINEALRREYDQFVRYLEQRAAQPRITVLGLWSRMRERIMSNMENEIFFVPNSDEIEILINRDMVRMRELEEQRTIQRQQDRALREAEARGS